MECGRLLILMRTVKLCVNLDERYNKKDVACYPVGSYFHLIMFDFMPQIKLLNFCKNLAGKVSTTHSPIALISHQVVTTLPCIEVMTWIAAL